MIKINNKQPGFTIVELLIVVVVIGILAAIVIVAYNGITNSAHESTVKSDLANIAKKVELFRVEKGVYPADETELEEAAIQVTKGSYQERNNLYYCTTSDKQRYAVGAYVVNGTQYYLVDGNVANASGVNSGNTCAQLGITGGSSQGVGYKDWTSPQWQDWVE
jgi:type II secretion system protein G